MHCEDLVHREEHLLDVRRAHGVVQTARDALAFEALRDGPEARVALGRRERAALRERLERRAGRHGR
jgi:hypothetical protein